MMNRFAPMVLAIATGLTMACGDAAVESITAPKIAATPAQPVANQFPTVDEVEGAGIPAAASIQMSATTRFEDNWRTFVASLTVTVRWSNDASAQIDAWVQNRNGQVINQGSAGMKWRRWMLPVMQGDTTFTVRVSTNGITCGLVGKARYQGRAAQMAVELSKLIEIELASQTFLPTTSADTPQPDCPPDPGCEEPPASRVISAGNVSLAAEPVPCDEAPPPPGGGVPEPVEICVAVWRQHWLYDFATGRLTLLSQYFIGVICYTVTMS